MRVGSDFSGVGAFEQSLIKLGIDYKTVFACDIDKFARQTYVLNYGEPDYFPENVYDRKIPNDPLDIYMTSPPCQSFSIAGKRLGEDDDRGILFYNSLQFIRENKPRVFIIENVRGLLSDNNGQTFNSWTTYLSGKSLNGVPTIFPHPDSVPYHVHYKVLNSTDFQTPQHRPRVFIVGLRDDENYFSWPKEEILTLRLKDILEPKVDSKYFLSKKAVEGIIKHREEQSKKGNNFQAIISSPEEISATITARYHKDGTCQLIQVGSVYKANSDAGRVYSIKGIACTIKAEGGGMGAKTGLYDTGDNIRRLTPRECFRLMSFPDSFKLNVSDSQAYRQAGNSIDVNVLSNIIKQIKWQK